MNKAKYKQKLQDIFPGADFKVAEKTGRAKTLGEEDFKDFEYLSFKHSDGYFLFYFAISERDTNRLSYEIYVPDMSASVAPLTGGIYLDESSEIELRNSFQELVSGCIERMFDEGFIDERRKSSLRQSLENLG